MDTPLLLSRVRRGCLAAAAALVLVGAGMAAWHRPHLARRAAALALAGARIAHPEVVEQRAGRMAWRLSAEEARERDGVMVLERPRLEVAVEGGGTIVARAPQGVFAPDTRDARLVNGARARWGDWRLAAPVLAYDAARDALVAPRGFVLARAGWGRARGARLVVERTRRRLVATGSVRVEVRR